MRETRMEIPLKIVDLLPETRELIYPNVQWQAIWFIIAAFKLKKKTCLCPLSFANHLYVYIA
jgi:hypothetical protein